MIVLTDGHVHSKICDTWCGDLIIDDSLYMPSIHVTTELMITGLPHCRKGSILSVREDAQLNIHIDEQSVSLPYNLTVEMVDRKQSKSNGCTRTYINSDSYRLVHDGNSPDEIWCYSSRLGVVSWRNVIDEVIALGTYYGLYNRGDRYTLITFDEYGLPKVLWERLTPEGERRKARL